MKNGVRQRRHGCICAIPSRCLMCSRDRGDVYRPQTPSVENAPLFVEHARLFTLHQAERNRRVATGDTEPTALEHKLSNEGTAIFRQLVPVNFVGKHSGIGGGK